MRLPEKGADKNLAKLHTFFGADMTFYDVTKKVKAWEYSSLGGHFTHKDDILAVVDVEGNIFIAPNTPKRIKFLSASLGYYPVGSCKLPIPPLKKLPWQ
jgi:hypothetical protein